MDKPIDGLTVNEYSGTSVSLSSDGTTVAIGTPYANSSTGATRIYKWNNTTWIMLGSQITEAANERSGTSVSLSSDGTTVAIGAPNANSTTGTTRIYKYQL
jgi:protein-disulfide isomerase